MAKRVPGVSEVRLIQAYNEKTPNFIRRSLREFEFHSFLRTETRSFQDTEWITFAFLSVWIGQRYISLGGKAPGRRTNHKITV